MRFVALTLLVVPLGFIACDGAETTACEPNATIACDCADGTQGTGVCSADGEHFGVCACGASACSADLFVDAENCGACGHSCQGGGCVDAQCLPVTLTTEPANTLAVTADSIYFTAGSATGADGVVKKMPLAGGATTTLASGQARPYGLLVDGTRVVWSLGDAPYGIWTVPVGGGTPTALVPDVDAYRMTMDATNLYWTSGATLLKAPLAGGPSVTLASPTDCKPFDLVVDATNVYFTCASNQSPSFDTVHAVPIAGGADNVIVDEPDQFGNGIAIAGTTLAPSPPEPGRLAWTVQSGLHGAPIAGGPFEDLIEGLSFAGTLATDGAAFYVNSSGGWVTSVPIDGGRPVVVATQLDPSPSDIAVDAAFIYLGGAGGIQRVAK